MNPPAIKPFMTFFWPDMLWGLIAVPLLVLIYVWLQRRRKKTTLRYANLGLVREALGKRIAWRRHLPPALMLTAITALLFAAARPAAIVTLPSQQETIILAIDVSGSMRASDVLPDRITAAKEAAKAFVAELPRNVRIAVVQFAGTAAVVQAPTLSRDDVVAALDRFQLQRGTAIGSGIVLSLATLFPDAGIDLSQITGQRDMPPGPNDKPKPDFTPVAPGSYPVGRDHPADRWPAHHRPRPGRGREDGGRSRRAHLHGRRRHQGGRDDRLRRLVDARAAR